MLISCTTLVEVQSDWEGYLQRLPACDVDEDCVVIEPGCPLGCYTSVPASNRVEAETFAEELVDRYDTVLRPCVYECSEPPPIAICQMGSCFTGARVPSFEP
ncbi:MAG: hypothetical protein AAF602_25035 [Myxococcota bacterium]